MIYAWAAFLLGVWSAALPCGAQNSPTPTTPTPPARAADRPQPIAEVDWMRRVAAQQHALTNQRCQVCFIGDSLTEFWTHTGQAEWETRFAPLQAINLGLTADRTEHILERIRRLDFSRARPQVVVLLMGTNNLGMEPPDAPADVARAIQAAVALVQKKMPGTKVVLLTIPPSGVEPDSSLRQRIRQTNELLTNIQWPGTVTLLQVYPLLVDDADRWKPGYTLDGTHFSAGGYGRLADVLEPVVKNLLGEKAAPQR